MWLAFRIFSKISKYVYEKNAMYPSKKCVILMFLYICCVFFFAGISKFILLSLKQKSNPHKKKEDFQKTSRSHQTNLELVEQTKSIPPKTIFRSSFGLSVSPSVDGPQVAGLLCTFWPDSCNSEDGGISVDISVGSSEECDCDSPRRPAQSHSAQNQSNNFALRR